MSAHFDTERSRSTQHKQKGVIQTPLIIVVIVVAVIGLLAYSKGWIKVPASTTPPQANLPVTDKQEISSPAPIQSGSAKGVVIVKTPAKGEQIKSPLTVSGFVYGNNGTLTIKLKQKTSGQYVTDDKVVKISGKADKISFAEGLQFGLPVMPQTGVLEIEYKDKSGKGLDDKVAIEVEFPTDLGKGN